MSFTAWLLSEFRNWTDRCRRSQGRARCCRRRRDDASCSPVTRFSSKPSSSSACSSNRCSRGYFLRVLSTIRGRRDFARTLRFSFLCAWGGPGSCGITPLLTSWRQSSILQDDCELSLLLALWRSMRSSSTQRQYPSGLASVAPRTAYVGLYSRDFIFRRRLVLEDTIDEDCDGGSEDGCKDCCCGVSFAGIELLLFPSADLDDASKTPFRRVFVPSFYKCITASPGHPFYLRIRHIQERREEILYEHT